jgi:hypothetical protein
MGLDFLAATFILHEHKYRPIKGRVLTIGRQSIGLTPDLMDRLLAAYDIPRRPGHVYRPEGNTVGVVRSGDMISQESFFGAFTEAEVRSLDVSAYENADIVCDLQGQVPEELRGTSDFIYNGSCLDNIFDAPAALRNMTRLLKPDGRVYHYEQGNSHPTAYLKYSADWFMDYYALNQFADCKTYVCDKPTSLLIPLRTIPDQRRPDIGIGTPSLQGYGIIIYAFNPVVDNGSGCGYDCSSVEAMTRYEIHCLAEKGPGATADRAPIQKHYRVEPEHVKDCYEGAVRFWRSPRPLYFNPFHFDAERIPRIDSADYPEVMKPVGVIPRDWKADIAGWTAPASGSLLGTH